MNSKKKGKGGELEFAKVLRFHGWEARRGVQYGGGGDAPDLVTNTPFHWEVKRCEYLAIRDWMAQAERDAAGKPWAIAWRRNSGPWMAILKANDFLPLL